MIDQKSKENQKIQAVSLLIPQGDLILFPTLSFIINRLLGRTLAGGVNTIPNVMAKNKSIIKLEGTLGDITFYNKNGQNLAKLKSEVSKARIMKDPSFARTRENMSEFGGSASIGKSIRLAFANFLKTFASKTISAKLTGLCFRVIGRDPTGNRGQRSFELLANKDILVGYDLNEDSVGAVFFPPYTHTVNTDRNEVTMDIPAFDPSIYLIPPQGATHFQVILAIGVVSNHTYDIASKKYVAVNAVENSMNGSTDSGFLSIFSPVPAQQLVASLPGAPVLSTDSSLITAVGIRFSQEVNGQQYPLYSDDAMRIDEVF